MQKRVWLTWLLFIGCMTSALAQSAKLIPAEGTNNDVTADKTMLKIPVWVESAPDTFWQEGKRKSFKVFVEDQEMTIKSFQHPKSSTILLVVFDTVADLARVEQARKALRSVMDELGSQYWIGLLKAQDGLSVLQEPTANREVLKEKIQKVAVNGKAGLLDTIEPVAQLADAMLRKASVRLSVLYITDSGIANYRADYLNPVINSSDSGDLSRRFSDRAVQERISRLKENLSRYTVPIYVLHLEQRNDSLNLAYQSGLDRVAANSGGKALFCRTQDEILPSLNSLITRIRSSYVVSVDASTSKRKSLKVRVEAQDAEGNNLNRITYPSQVTVGKK